MSRFVVSARKYRPDHFSTVLGQKQVTETLKNAIKTGRLAQSFLFCGPRGVGKTSCARILAKTINCMNLGSDYEACGDCESCISFAAGNSFNIQELDAASNNSVEDIRSLVEQIRYAPQSGKYKIYIIDEVHMLSQNAFNAFLKTLEEPPSYVIFILATTEKQKIIPTILSRCQIFDFKRITVKDAADHLAFIASQEDIGFEPEALHLIAQKSDGAMRDALSIFDQLSIFTSGQITYKAVLENLHILDLDYYFRVMDCILEEDIPGVLLILDEILQNGFNGNDFLSSLSTYFRDLLVSKDESTLSLLEVMPQTQEKYRLHSGRVSPGFLLNALSLTNQAEIQYRNSKNQRLQVELALLKLCHIPSVLRFAEDSLPEASKKKPLSSDNSAFIPQKLDSEKGFKEGSEGVVEKGFDTDTIPNLKTNTIPSPAKTIPQSELEKVPTGKLQDSTPENPNGYSLARPKPDPESQINEPLKNNVLMEIGKENNIPKEPLPESLPDQKNSSLPVSAREIRFKLPKRGDMVNPSLDKNSGSNFSTISPKREEKINALDVQKAWAKLLATIEKKQNHALYSILETIQPELCATSHSKLNQDMTTKMDMDLEPSISPEEENKEEDHFNILLLRVQNQIQKTLILEESDEIIHFLREELRNDFVRLEWKMSPDENISTTPFTAHDKLKYLADINPVLLDLKTRLGLDIDY